MHGIVALGIRGSTFSYDALGRRVTESDASNSQYFYYNGQQMIENAPQSGSSVRHQQFVYGLAYIDQVILRDRDADNSSGTGSLGLTGSGLEERLYYTHNREYSVTGLVSQTGTMLERTAYDPYGGLQYFSASYGSGTSTSAYANSVGFTGRWKDPTGMWYFRARYEDPVLGRFVSRDPFSYIDGLNLYSAYLVPGMLDSSGTFDTDDHNTIINNALTDPGNGFSPTDVKDVQDGSYDSDHQPGAQDPSNAYQHGMRAPGQDPAVAAQQTQDFMNQMMDKASDMICNGDRDGGMKTFGHAAHAGEDTFSPFHRDENGVPKPWRGLWNPMSWPHAVENMNFRGREAAMREATVDTAELAKDLKAMVCKKCHDKAPAGWCPCSANSSSNGK